MPFIMSNSHRPGIPGIDIDDHWQEEWGSRREKRSRPWKLGLPTEAKYFPNSGYLTNKPKTIPNIFCQRWWYCDEEIKDTIESLEPSRHRFYPFALRASKIGDVRAELFIIHALEPIEVIDVKHSPGVREVRTHLEVPQGVRMSRPNKKWTGNVILKRDYPKDRHIWRDSQVETPNGIFISDHLHSIFKQSKNVCVSYMKMWGAGKLE